MWRLQLRFIYSRWG